MKINKLKLVSYLGMVALLASMVVGLLGYSNYTVDIELIKNHLLTNHMENNINLTMKYINSSYGTLTSGNGTLLDQDGNSIEGRYEVVDSIFEDLGDKSTIFVKVNDDFKRISTNIMTSDNTRAIGTYLGTAHKAYQTLIRGELYVGEARILNENYYTAYKPVKDANNNVIGVLFVGLPTQALDNIISVHDSEMNIINILIIVLRAISLGALIILVSATVVNKKTDCPSDPTNSIE